MASIRRVSRRRLALPSFVAALARRRRLTGVAAGRQTGEPNHAGNVGGRSLWWTWTPAADTRVTIETCGSMIDTLLAVYTGETLGTLTQVAASDTLCGNNGSVTFRAVAGQTYKVAADGRDGAMGPISLSTGIPPANGASPTPRRSTASRPPPPAPKRWPVSSPANPLTDRCQVDARSGGAGPRPSRAAWSSTPGRAVSPACYRCTAAVRWTRSRRSAATRATAA